MKDDESEIDASNIVFNLHEDSDLNDETPIPVSKHITLKPKIPGKKKSDLARAKYV